MRIGLFGGSFDPVHQGHLLPVREAVAALDLARVYYLPTAQPPHKPPRTAPPHRRFAMVEIALLGEPDLRVSADELTPGRNAYTVDSVRRFRGRFPESVIHLLIGEDSFLELTSWRAWREIVSTTILVVLARPGWRIEESQEPPAELGELIAGGGVRFLDNAPAPFASRQIRALLAAGKEPPSGVLPAGVLDYIRKYDLYR